MNSPYFGFDPNYNTLFIRSIPTNISREDIMNIVSKVDGLMYLSLSEPQKNKDFSRLGWIIFDTVENCDKAAE